MSWKESMIEEKDHEECTKNVPVKAVGEGHDMKTGHWQITRRCHYKKRPAPGIQRCDSL
jgi:hypothetical protein